MVHILEFSSSLHLYIEIEAVTAVSLLNDVSRPDIRSEAKQGKIIQNIPDFFYYCSFPKMATTVSLGKK